MELLEFHTGTGTTGIPVRGTPVPAGTRNPGRNIRSESSTFNHLRIQKLEALRFGFQAVPIRLRVKFHLRVVESEAKKTPDRVAC